MAKGNTRKKKPVLAQNKDAETPPLSQLPSKKQKVAGGDAVQSIDQLNDVTAVSGVNLREEEEQLLAGPREGSRTTEAIREALQDEEDRLFLDREFLLKKLHDVATANGFRSVGEDTEKCLSKATEEYMCGMLQNIIKLSNQRCDSWKDRHKVVVTTNVWRDVLLKRKKDKEALEKKQEEKEALEKNLAELKERLQKLTEKKNIGTLADLAERRAKRQKIREEEEAKRQQIREEEEAKREVSATNKAARRALGADDMLSKWAKLAEQGWQKRQGGDGRPQHNRPVTTTGRPPGPGSASAGGSPSAQVERSQRLITMKDVLAAMERDIHLGKSTLLYELYERDRKTSSYVADRTMTRSHLLADGTVIKR